MVEREKVEMRWQPAKAYPESTDAFLQKLEKEKATESLCGGNVQGLKAMAASRGHAVRQDRGIIEYAGALAREIHGLGLWTEYFSTEHLHSAFCKMGLSLEAVRQLLEITEEPTQVGLGG
ncbi:MAG: hypothetical protein ACK4K2_08875 [Dehalococcoidia bacterium]